MTFQETRLKSRCAESGTWFVRIEVWFTVTMYWAFNMPDTVCKLVKWEVVPHWIPAEGRNSSADTHSTADTTGAVRRFTKGIATQPTVSLSSLMVVIQSLLLDLQWVNLNHWMSLLNGWATREIKSLPYVESKSLLLWLLLTSKRKPSYIFFIEVALSVYFSYMSLLRLFFYSQSVPISSIIFHAILLKVWRT